MILYIIPFLLYAGAETLILYVVSLAFGYDNKVFLPGTSYFLRVDSKKN